MGTRADIHYLFARAAVQFNYDWGGVFMDALSGTEDTDPLSPDCSGLLIGLWRMSDTKFGVKKVDYKTYFGTSRPTSRTMYAKATKIAQPSKYGDLGFRKDADGIVRHVLIYLGTDAKGRGITVEAGYHGGYYSPGLGRSWRGSHHVGLDFVDWQNSQGVVWGRIPTDLGERDRDSPTSPFPWWPVLDIGSNSQYVRLVKSLINQVRGYRFALNMTDRKYGYYTYKQVKAVHWALGIEPYSGVADEDFIQAIQRYL